MINKNYFFTFVFLILFLYWLVFFVPPDSDEFLAYYNIACTQFEGSRLAYVSGYNISCDNFTLKFFGLDYIKSYTYLGLISAFIYKPFYMIYPYVESHYIYAIIFLILFSYLLTKSLDLKKEIFLIPMMYFPFTFIFLHDSGPVKIAMISLPLLIIIFKKILNSNKNHLHNFSLVFLSTLLIILAIEDKSFYIFLLPSFVIAAFLFSLYKAKKKIIFFNLEKNNFSIKISKLLILQIAFFCIILSIAIFLMFIASTKYVQRYDLNIPYIAYLYGLSPKASFFDQINYLLLYIFSPIAYADRIFEIEKSLFDTKNLISMLSFLPIIFLLFSYIRSCSRKLVTTFLLPLSLLILIFLIFRNTWSGHHFIYLHLFLLPLLMLYANLNSKNYLKITLALILCIGVNILLLSYSNINSRSSKEIAEVSKYLRNENIANESIINFSSWGGYLQQSIYGKKFQIVTMADPINLNIAKELNDLRIEKNRSYIINVCNNCKIENIIEIFKDSKKIEFINLDTNTWKVMKISYK